MDARRFIAGTFVGAVVLFVTGYLIFNMALGGFYDANMSFPEGVERAAPLYWAFAACAVSYAALITYALAGRAVSTGSGAVVGAIVGLLAWLTVDLLYYGMTTLSSLTLVFVDPLIEAIHGGLGGMAIAAVLSRMSPAGRASAKTSTAPEAIAR